MRIHTNTLTAADIQKAARVARVSLEGLSKHGSRSAARAFEVKLTGNSARRPNGGTHGANDGYAATWDQWGVFLSALYALDPDMTCWAYTDAEDFAFQTGGRFANGWPSDAHGDHRWNVGMPYQQKCLKCSAVRRWGPR